MTTVKTASHPDSIFKSLLLVPENSGEWIMMWAKLSSHKINKDLENPHLAENSGEVWEYMESIKNVGLWGYKHIFRHRLHPKTEQEERITIQSSFRLKIVQH